MKSRKFEIATLTGILFVFLTLGFWGLQWGFPLQRAYIDEFVTVFYSMHLFDTGPHPQFFDYPSFFLYILWGLVAFVKSLTGNAALELSAFMHAQSTSPILIGRILNVTFGAVGIVFIYLTSRTWRSAQTGLWAAAFLALHPIYVQMCHYAMPDILSVTLSTAGAFAWVLFLRRGQSNFALLSGFLLGLGVATKYTPGFLAAGLLFWLLLQNRLKLSLFFSGAVISGSFIGSPFHFLDWPAFFPRFSHLFFAFVGREFQFMSIFERLWDTLIFLPHAINLLLLILTVSGIILSRKDPLTQSLGAACLFYLLGIGLFSGKTDRYLLPLVPIACLWSANMAVHLTSRFRQTKYILCLLILFFLVRPTTGFLKILSQKDTRLIALDWIRTNIPHDVKILRFPHTPEFTRLDPYFVRVDWEEKMKTKHPKDLLKNFDYIITAHYEDKALPWEKKWADSAQNILTVPRPGHSIPFPLHPRIRVWTRQPISSQNQN